MDFLYTCDTHLSDPGFASQVGNANDGVGAGGAKKMGLSPEEIAKVKAEYEERQKKKAEKAKEKDKDKEKQPAFTFGSASPGKPSLFSAGFGTAKAGSIGNPVGFGFGSPPKTPDVDSAGASASASGPVKALPFAFGAPLSKPDASSASSAFGASGGEGGSSGSAEGTPAPDGEQAPPPAPLLAASSAHDQEGEGEEGEETVHEIRSKVFRMGKDKDGRAQWADVGVGVLRVKRHKETDARRVLLRNSSTGKITIVSRPLPFSPFLRDAPGPADPFPRAVVRCARVGVVTRVSWSASAAQTHGDAPRRAPSHASVHAHRPNKAER